MGDIGVTYQPEVVECTTGAEEQLLLVCSDGVWEFIGAEEAVSVVKGYPPEQLKEACAALAKLAWDRWIAEEEVVVDDITAVGVYLPGHAQYVQTLAAEGIAAAA